MAFSISLLLQLAGTHNPHWTVSRRTLDGSIALSYRNIEVNICKRLIKIIGGTDFSRTGANHD